MFACNGILFNHESQEGVKHRYKKVQVCRIKYKKQKILYLGNIYSKRDWGMQKNMLKQCG